MAVAGRVESFVGTGDLPSTVLMSTGTRGDGGDSHPKGHGKRFDPSKTVELRTRQDYIEQKRAGLALIAGGEYFAALRVFLAGRMPVAPLALGGVVAPAVAAAPMLVFHIILFDDKVEPWQIDPDLQPLAALRAHIPAYLGSVATGTMRGGPWDCQLRAMTKSWQEPEKWAPKDASAQGSPPSVENDVWRVVIASKHGEEGLEQGAIAEVTRAEAYSTPYLMYATRSFAIKTMQALGVSVEASIIDTQPSSVADVWDEGIDRMDGHGVLAVLRSGVLASVHSLIVGCFGEFGLRLAAARRSRDLTTALPTAFVIYPSQAVVDWNLKAVLYEGAAKRRREDSLVIANPGGHTAVPLSTLGGSGSDAASLLSSRNTEPVSSELAELKALAADFKKVLLGKKAGTTIDTEKKPKEPLPPLKLQNGTWLFAGKPARWSKEKMTGLLQEAGIDPKTVCMPHNITRTYGGTIAECKRDCPDHELHAADGSEFHRFLGKFKISDARVDSAFEDGKAKRLEMMALAKAGTKRGRA